MPILELKNLNAYYKVKRNEYLLPVNNVSFKVESGEFVVILGTSGSGKTTLLKAILGLIDDTSGEILYNGQPIEKLKNIDKNFGYVSQEYSLYPQFTIFENIAYPLRVIKTDEQEIKERVFEIAKLLEIENFLTRKPRQLSGGQQQRVAIARALIKNPSLILFDEPFSNIDPVMRLELRKLVKDISSSRNITILFVTHDISEAFMLASRILVINGGEIVEDGKPMYLMEHSRSRLIKEYFSKENKNIDELI